MVRPLSVLKPRLGRRDSLSAILTLISNPTIYRSESPPFMLLIFRQSADPGASCLKTKFLKGNGECRRLDCVTAPGSGTWLLTLRGTSRGLCDGRSIVCAGASGISVKDSKLNSFIHHWIFSGVASASFRERIAADS